MEELEKKVDIRTGKSDAPTGRWQTGAPGAITVPIDPKNQVGPTGPSAPGVNADEKKNDAIKALL